MGFSCKGREGKVMLVLCWEKRNMAIHKSLRHAHYVIEAEVWIEKVTMFLASCLKPDVTLAH